MALTEGKVLRDSRLLVRSLIVLAAVLVGLSLHPVPNMETSTVALLGAGILVLVNGLGPDEYLVDIEWDTLHFFVGLFVMVGALVEVGAIDDLADALAEAVGDNVVWALRSATDIPLVLEFTSTARLPRSSPCCCACRTSTSATCVLMSRTWTIAPGARSGPPRVWVALFIKCSLDPSVSADVF